MVMAVKHQFLMCLDPRDLIGVTLNHLDAVGDYAKNPVAKKNVELAYELLLQVPFHGFTLKRPFMWNSSFAELLPTVHYRTSDNQAQLTKLPAGLQNTSLSVPTRRDSECGWQL